ncbi:MAG: MarR family winged helix-turn-helix transcriptional regulator [Steroidobacterales bacterium]|jgi:DNA-binding MarR family transcriptional regulator
MTRIVDGLEKAGLVERKHSTVDRRKIELLATPRGRRVLEAGRARRVAILGRALRQLSDVEFRVLERAVPVLQKLFPSQAAAEPSATGEL